MQDSASKQHNAANILGLEGELTMESLNHAYREARTRVESKVASSDIAATQTIAQIEWAYRELLSQIEARSQDDEETVVSAALLPCLSPEAAALLDSKENVVYISRRNTTEEAIEPVHPMDLPEFKSVEPARGGLPFGRSPLSTPERNPKMVRSLAFDSMKNAVPVHAGSTQNPEAISRLTGIIQSSEQITGSLLKKLREELNVSLDEINVRTKIPRKYILSIEADDYSNLPAVVYFRGFIMSYLRYLGLADRVDIADMLIENYRARLRHKSKIRPS